MRILAFAVTALVAVHATGLEHTPVQPPEYKTIPRIDRYATPEEYEAAVRDTRFRLTRVSYLSDGLTVFAYVYAPAEVPKAKLPVVVFNRGSYLWKEFAGEYLTSFHRLASAGFVVVAPMYRGSGGAEGKDEVGGADLNDVMNTVDVIRQIPSANPGLVFLYGESRGAMMVYQAIRERYPMRAAAVYGGFTDFGLLADPGARFAQVALSIWPDYADRREEITRRRSAIRWPEKFDTPVLIMHGGADDGVPPSHALALATRLQELGKRYSLIIRAGSNHHLSDWRVERDAAAVEWFRSHMK